MSTTPLLPTQLLEVLSRSNRATAIYTTNDIIIEWANDAMLAFWHRDKSIIGLPLAEGVPELKGQPFIGILQNVLKTGTDSIGEGIAAELAVKGKLQTFYFDYEYRAIKNDAGQPYCILHTATDVTEKILNRHALKKARELEEAQKRALVESEQNLRLVILQAPIAIAIFRGPTYIVETVNARALELWGRTETEVMRKPILEAMPELEGQGIKALLDEVYHGGKSFSFTELPVKLTRQEKVEDTFINFVYEPLYDANNAINGLITIGTEVTDQVNARRELETARENLKLSIDAAEMGTFDMDIKKGTMYWDDRCRELFGISNHNEVNYEKDFVGGLHPDDRNRIINIIDNQVMVQAISNGDYDVEYRTVGAEDGKTRWVRAKGKVYFEDDGTPRRFIGAVLDITEQKHDEQRKNDFIGMVSHELKTPLTSLSAYVQIMQLKAQNDDYKAMPDTLDKANIQVKRMSTMINGFLNMSRLESGKILLEKQIFDLVGLIADTIAETMPASLSHHITFAPCTAIIINADRVKIGSVISNVLSNAVKYSPKEKSIHVACQKINGMAQVSITDQGIGIDQQDTQKLFDRYYRVENPNHKHISGFGIGLYLSAEIINRHNGKIWVESKLGRGSTFYFRLPLG
ncbi:ATP-binding protein [Mucilaginibacter sp. FT3.2]|uniref:ATP-binding protein n=1 Tax=Mucilaginibacter sp. FT3.2 TaxID=2723090 RepID=UPI0016227F9D|nr:ATP-binding protein [Mucilaginibacter sp. FT3.2]MBB6235379.1 PAS domain S-box-containing protein [Mucilaginibacter sp. FT3.2]